MVARGISLSVNTAYGVFTKIVRASSHTMCEMQDVARDQLNCGGDWESPSLFEVEGNGFCVSDCKAPGPSVGDVGLGERKTALKFDSESKS
ncbi:hypothetical protein Aspvir_004336 [Aspergillus viridinutans]|uniref:Uncharacterized protein n=1 Tax=Aspergillus viridinutans TaxID=75553 RepID=A0A9P3F0G6_ASPVI|nr:uncharacterized protein Aspvir_004336 [Aspergillus viridinutans]GIK00314.1 hypothetical protein Aspvir_004336 [Aspergillus viridinutans]